MGTAGPLALARDILDDGQPFFVLNRCQSIYCNARALPHSAHLQLSRLSPELHLQCQSSHFATLILKIISTILHVPGWHVWLEILHGCEVLCAILGFTNHTF